MFEESYVSFVRVRVGRFLFLLISIVLMFVLRPFLEGVIGITVLMDIFFSAILISGVYAISRKRGVFLGAVGIAAPALVLQWSLHALKVPLLLLLAEILSALFFTYAVIIIIEYLYRAKNITADVVIGGICVYFLLGLIWAFVFSILEYVQPGSFHVPMGSGSDSHFAYYGMSHFAYYSFVTLTTLGFGDITPVSDPARSLSLLEAIVGQLYLAVLVARLVGIHISQLTYRE